MKDNSNTPVNWDPHDSPESIVILGNTEAHPRRNLNERHETTSTESLGRSPYHSRLHNTNTNTRVPHSDGYLATLRFHRESKNSGRKSGSKPLKFAKNDLGTNTQHPHGQGSNSNLNAAVRKSGALSVDPRRKRDVIGGSTYSRSLLIDARTLTKGPAPTYLRYLVDVDHLFFKACKKFPPEIKDFNPMQKRGLWNAAGRCVYYLGLTDSYLFRRFRSGFTYKVVDYLGNPVLTSTGSQWNFGFRGYVSVTLNDGFLLGTMEQEFLGSNYNVKDGQGRVVLTIQAPCYLPAVPYMIWCCREEFEICTDDGVSEIGKISRSWDDECPDFDGDLGIEFECEDDNRIKALLLGVSFLIEFQYYKNGGNGITYFFCVSILLAAVVFILSNGFGFYPELHSFLIQPPDVET